MSTTSPHSPPTGLARAVGAAARAAAQRPKRTIALWLALVVGCVAAGALSPTHSLSDAGSGVGQSAAAQARLNRSGLADPATETLLATSPDRARTAATLAALARSARPLPDVRGVTAPATLAGGRTGLVVVTLRGDPNDSDSHVDPLLHAVAGVRAAHPGVTVREAGQGSAGHAINQVVDRGLHRAEMISLPITLVILVLAFGALAAATVPLLLGITSVVAALGLSGPISHLVPMGGSTSPVIVLIGLAVGVDYSLFYIRRERAERRAHPGRDGAETALQAAADTVGRAIVIAGATVVIGLAGLLCTGFGVFTSMALGAITVVAIAVVGSLTVLPATLALLGDRIDSGRLWHRRARGAGPRRGARGHGLQAARPIPRPGRFGALSAPKVPRPGLSRAVTRHPHVSLAMALVPLIALAVPVLSMRTSNPGEQDLSASTPAIVAQRAIDHAHPSAYDTAALVITGHGLATSAARAPLTQLGREGERIAGTSGAVTTRVAPDGDTALVTIPMRDEGLSAERATVDALRDRLGRASARLLPGTHLLLGGDAAEDVDLTQRLSTVTPLVIASVLALAFVLLVAAFGSPVLAVAVIALNLLSVGAAFGVLVTVFQHGWAQSLLHFTSDGAIVTWLPLFAFVVLFGLSMDYTVLILERAREARRHGASAPDAAAQALSATGSTVTSAAAVMVGVFAVFATLPLLEFKQLGIGLAVAIAIDATIVRGLALPATLSLLGDRGLRPARPRRPRPQPRWDHDVRVPALEHGHE